MVSEMQQLTSFFEAIFALSVATFIGRIVLANFNTMLEREITERTVLDLVMKYASINVSEQSELLKTIFNEDNQLIESVQDMRAQIRREHEQDLKEVDFNLRVRTKWLRIASGGMAVGSLAMIGLGSLFPEAPIEFDSAAWLLGATFVVSLVLVIWLLVLAHVHSRDLSQLVDVAKKDLEIMINRRITKLLEDSAG